MSQFTFTTSTKEAQIEEGSHFPQSLKQEQCWLCYKLVGDKPNKIPYAPRYNNGDTFKAGVSSENEFVTYDEAKAFAEQEPSIADCATVFTADSPYVGVDLDDCVEDGIMDDWAEEIVERLDSYTEVSQSGTGLHIYVEGELDDEYANRHDDLEMYEEKRFFAITGRHVMSTPETIEDRSEELVSVQRENMPESSLSGSDVEYDSWDSVELNSSESDVSASVEDVIDTAERYSDKFWYLHNDKKSYNNGDTSKDDCSYCRQLAFWTQKDEAMMKEIWLNHSERTRPKTGRTDYVVQTIKTAVRSCDETYSGEY